jgi:flavin reductase (DIM6/NTAB) family NADH-FMN oxidoreductase RutF
MVASFYNGRRGDAMHTPTDALTPEQVYRFLTAAVVPRPIAWVTTVDPASGVVNAAPFSFFTVCCIDPPMVCFAAGSAAGGAEKDTVRNTRAAGEFVVNVVSEELGEAMNVTATPFPAHVSELAEAGLTPAPSVAVRPPRIAESPINMECRLDRMVELGRPPDTHHLVIGQVVGIHVRDGLLTDDYRVDLRGLRALGRLAGNLYCRTGDWVRHARRSPDEGPRQAERPPSP